MSGKANLSPRKAVPSPEEFALSMRRTACRFCVAMREHPEAAAEVDRARRESGMGAVALAKWLAAFHGVAIDRNMIQRHWIMQDEGHHS